MNAISEDTKVRTSINRLLSWGAGIVIAMYAAMTVWNKQQRDVEELNKTVSVQASDISSLKTDVAQVQIGMVKFQANQEAQIEILRYLANDRRGPKPEAAK